MTDFFSQYLQYTDDTEPPKIFHRWCAIASIGALLGRNYFFNHGHFVINPNIYCMLIGSPGTRKSTAIKLAKKLLVTSGYTTIAAEKTTKEKFLMDLAGEESEHNGTDILDQNLFGDTDADQDREIFIMADEFNDFFGNGNIEFISLLGTLWDFAGVYRNRIKNSKSVSISNPTVSILGGNTPTGFALAFPTEIFGQGFFSRLLLIYGESSGKRITFPKAPSQESTAAVIESLRRIKQTAYGESQVSHTAQSLLSRIYTGGEAGIDDIRFESYITRRFSHLLKLCLICSAARESREITEADVIHANTLLTYTERFMPKALGEFGKAKNSDISHRVIQYLESAHGIVPFKELWANVRTDLEKPQDLVTLLQNLLMAEKIQQVPGGAGYLPRRRVIEYTNSSVLDFSYLTEEEKKVLT